MIDKEPGDFSWLFLYPLSAELPGVGRGYPAAAGKQRDKVFRLGGRNPLPVKCLEWQQPRQILCRGGSRELPGKGSCSRVPVALCKAMARTFRFCQTLLPTKLLTSNTACGMMMARGRRYEGCEGSRAPQLGRRPQIAGAKPRKVSEKAKQRQWRSFS